VPRTNTSISYSKEFFQKTVFKFCTKLSQGKLSWVCDSLTVISNLNCTVQCFFDTDFEKMLSCCFHITTIFKKIPDGRLRQWFWRSTCRGSMLTVARCRRENKKSSFLSQPLIIPPPSLSISISLTWIGLYNFDLFFILLKKNILVKKVINDSNWFVYKFDYLICFKYVVQFMNHLIWFSLFWCNLVYFNMVQ